MNLKDLISDVNVNEIYEHIETETLSEWVNAWQKAALSTLTPPNEWVSVEERLPEDYAPARRKQITVLVCSKAGRVSTASRVYEPEREYCGKVYPARWCWSKLMNNYVTHWMPMPAPPDRRPPEGEA